MNREHHIAHRLLTEWLAALELLIEQQFKALLGLDEKTERNEPNSDAREFRAAQNAKIPELIKMIELYAKLSEGQTGTKEFWDMIEKIRQEKIPLTPLDPPPAAITNQEKEPKS